MPKELGNETQSSTSKVNREKQENKGKQPSPDAHPIASSSMS
jgi:hypothetical protein